MPVLQYTYAQQKDLLPDSLSFCWGDSAFVELKHTIDNNSSITWTTPQGIVTNTRRISAQKQGKYYVRVSSGNSAKVYTDSCFVRMAYRIRPAMRDTAICKGKSLVLDCKYPGIKYQWSTGETAQRITVETAGRYWVKMRNGSCVTVDTVKVKLLPAMAVSVPNDLVFCANEEPKVITVKGAPNTRYMWNTGVTTASLQVTKEGRYWLRSESGLCGKQIDTVKVKIKMCDCEMIIPGSFSPNEDNRNDYFAPQSSCEYSYFFITISDRWGNIVYTSTNSNGRWDGRFKGNLCPEDIYVYRIETTEKAGDKKMVRSGKVSLFR